MKKAIYCLDRICDYFAVLAGALLVFMLLSVCAEVLLRYFVGYSLIWEMEINEYNILFITFLAAPWILKKNAHVRMDAILTQFKTKTQHLINTITSVIGAVVFFVIAWHGVTETWELFRINYLTPSVLELPKYLLVSVIFIGSLLLALQFVIMAYRYSKQITNHR